MPMVAPRCENAGVDSSRSLLQSIKVLTLVDTCAAAAAAVAAALVKLSSIPDFDKVGTSAVFRSSGCRLAAAFLTISIAIWARKPSSDLDRAEGTASAAIDNGEAVRTSAELLDIPSGAASMVAAELTLSDKTGLATLCVSKPAVPMVAPRGANAGVDSSRSLLQSIEVSTLVDTCAAAAAAVAAALVKLSSIPDFDKVGTSAVFRSSGCRLAAAFLTISIAIWARKPSSDLDRAEGTASAAIDNGEAVRTSAELLDIPSGAASMVAAELMLSDKTGLATLCVSKPTVPMVAQRCANAGLTRPARCSSRSRCRRWSMPARRRRRPCGGFGKAGVDA